MAYDLTGTSLTGYLVRLVRDIVNKNHRFRTALGDVKSAGNQMLEWDSVQVVIRDVTSDGTRLSPDYFMGVLYGRVILTKLSSAEGAFIEDVRDLEDPNAGLDPGVYYVAVTSVDESTGNVGIAIQKFLWKEGKIPQAQGSEIGFRVGIDATKVQLLDQNGNPVTTHLQGSSQFLLQWVTALTAKYEGNTLVPNVDFWVQRTESQTLIASTTFGAQTAGIPAGYTDFSLTNSKGYVLRPNIDYENIEGQFVSFSPWMNSGDTITISGPRRLDPTVSANLINPENVLNVVLNPGDTIEPDEVWVSTQSGSRLQVTPNPDGTVTLPTPLPPGGWCAYEMRINVANGLRFVNGAKNSINNSLLPGLQVTIGDSVVEGDQCAILVAPARRETYHMYGSRDNVHFTLDVQANDSQTASDILELIKRELLILRRESIEGDGISIFEGSRSTQFQTRDNSGTAMQYTHSYNMSASADWRVMVPLVTRITSFSITPIVSGPVFNGAVTNTPQYSACGRTSFISAH